MRSSTDCFNTERVNMKSFFSPYQTPKFSSFFSLSRIWRMETIMKCLKTLYIYLFFVYKRIVGIFKPENEYKTMKIEKTENYYEHCLVGQICLSHWGDMQ